MNRSAWQFDLLPELGELAGQLAHPMHDWLVPGYREAMKVLKWLYRLPGRLVGSFGPTLAATGVERGGMGGIGVDPTAVNVVAEEIESSTGSGDAPGTG